MQVDDARNILKPEATVFKSLHHHNFQPCVVRTNHEISPESFIMRSRHRIIDTLRYCCIPEPSPSQTDWIAARYRQQDKCSSHRSYYKLRGLLPNMARLIIRHLMGTSVRAYSVDRPVIRSILHPT